MDRFPPWCTAFFTNTLPIFTKFYEEFERSLTYYKIEQDARCFGVYISYVDVTRLLVGARARAVYKGKPLIVVSTPTWSRLSLIQVGESKILRLSLPQD